MSQQDRTILNENRQTIGVWQLFVLLMSIASLILLAVQAFVEVAGKQIDVLVTIDNIICFVFFGDFVWQLIISRPRRAYLKWGWLDLVSSIPLIPAFRIARLARVVRILRVLRGARAAKNIFAVIFIHRARNTFAAVVLGSFLLLLFTVVVIVTIEPSMKPLDAFWWCLFTLISGEYGDFLPSSTEGRIVTALLMTAGVALFGTFTASVASFFLEEDQIEDEQRDADMLHEIRQLTEEVSELRKQVMGDKTRG